MERFRSFSTPSHHQNIDRTKGVIYGCSVAVAGEAAGHKLIFDDTSLRQLLDIGNRKTTGIKSRFTHPGLSEDGLGKFLGRMKDFRFHMDKLIADLHLSESAATTPAGNLRDYLLNLASEDPAAFGISVVVDLEKFWIDQDGNEIAVKEPMPAKPMYKYPVARITSFVAADAVDEPALNPAGLFSASGSLVASNQVAEEVFNELDNYIQYLGFDLEKAHQFAQRYFQARGVDQSKGFSPLLTACIAPLSTLHNLNHSTKENPPTWKKNLVTPTIPAEPTQPDPHRPASQSPAGRNLQHEDRPHPRRRGQCHQDVTHAPP